MTDKEKLQKLFEAALKEPPHAPGHTPKRAFPQTPTPLPAVPHEAPILKPAPVVPVNVVPPDHEVIQPKAEPGASLPDDAASNELGKLLEERIAKQSSKRKRDTLIASLVFLGLTGGGLGWFVHSHVRVQAFTSAMSEIRPVTDVKGTVAEHHAALDKASSRSQQIDQATTVIGATSSAVDDHDPNMDAEMKAMMGGERKTVGERNRTLQAGFGDSAKAHGDELKRTVAISKEDSFQLAN